MSVNIANNDQKNTKKPAKSTVFNVKKGFVSVRVNTKNLDKLGDVENLILELCELPATFQVVSVNIEMKNAKGHRQIKSFEL
jgi:hypothetical protein